MTLIVIVVITFLIVFIFKAVQLGKQEDLLMEKLSTIEEDKRMLALLEGYTDPNKRYQRIKDLKEGKVTTKLFKDNQEEVDILESLESIKEIYRKDIEWIEISL